MVKKGFPLLSGSYLLLSIINRCLVIDNIVKKTKKKLKIRQRLCIPSLSYHNNAVGNCVPSLVCIVRSTFVRSVPAMVSDRGGDLLTVPMIANERRRSSCKLNISTVSIQTRLYAGKTDGGSWPNHEAPGNWTRCRQSRGKTAGRRPRSPAMSRFRAVYDYRLPSRLRYVRRCGRVTLTAPDHGLYGIGCTRWKIHRRRSTESRARARRSMGIGSTF